MSIQEKFKKILADSAFDQLASYTDPAAWNSMTHDEKELLGILFVKQGELQLNQGDSRVLESFELASRVAPHSPIIFFRQALVYAAQGQNIRCLIAAAAALEKATELDPYLMNAWHSFGNVLVRMGVFYEDATYFSKADEKFAEAERLGKLNSIRQSEAFYWHWAVCWFHHGKHSGEAVDYFSSLEKCRLAEEAGLDLPEFYNDYGNVLIELACLMGREELFLEAADRYEKVTVLAPSNYEGWLNLGCTQQRLYDFTEFQDYFNKSNECFERAAELNHEDSTIWLRWAELFTRFGKNQHNAEQIQLSFDKFKRAADIEQHNPIVLLRWGEAEMLYAAYTENLEILRIAEGKIRTALIALPDDPEAWCIYGTCLSELGRYFVDVKYYERAIEQYKEGLARDSVNPRLLHGILLACLALGELQEDPAMVEQAIAYCNHVGDKGVRVSPQFLSDWGVALMKLGEITNDRVHIERAAEKFEQAISGRLEEIEGDDIELEWLYNYGCALDFLGDFHDEAVYYEKAIQVLAHVLKLDPEYHHARYNLALTLSHLGELNSDVGCFTNSVEIFQQIVLNDPEDELTWNDYGIALLHLALLTYDPTTHSQMSRNFFEQAESKFLQAVALGNQHAFYNLACLHALTNRPEMAIHYLERGELCGALPDLDDVIHDEWLDSLRDQPAYRLFISRLLNQDGDFK
ncbi:MAG: hypothetical protein WCF65_00540 [Parachlamydiaceae bacterium]